MTRLALLPLLAALLLPGAAHGSGATYVVPFALDPYGGQQPEQDAFYGQGQVGVLMGRSPMSRLFAAWRLLHGQAVGAEAGHGLARPCCDPGPGVDISKDWLAARTAVPDVPEVKYLSLFRTVGEFWSVQTCFADAFATATRTLADRVAVHGTADGAVRAWLDGQDAVFANCGEDTPVPPLPADAPDWLQRDRAYQEAAAALYQRRFGDAEARFAAIAADGTSPWQALGPYLAARAAVAAALPNKDPALTERARARLAAIPAGAPGRDAVPGLATALDFRTDPAGRRRAVEAVLAAPTLPPDAAVAFKDLRRLGQSPVGQPEVLDWLSVFGRAPDTPGAAGWFEHYATETVWKTDADVLAHARERWAATKDPAWLVAALLWASPGPEAADLVAGARALPDTDPAWLTATYHRLRLDPGDPTEAARLLDAVLARADLSVSTRNLFTAQRALLAASPAEFTRLARRAQACVETEYDAPPSPTDCNGHLYGEPYQPAAPEGRFGDDALLTIDRLPLAARAAMSEDTELSAPLRLDLALTTWTGAVLAGDDVLADRLAGGLAVLLPVLAPDWQRFATTRAGPDKRFAAWFLLLKLPGAATRLSPSTNGDPNDYVRPVGAVKEFDGHWPDWAYAPAGAPAVPAPAAPADPVCLGLCGGGAYPYRPPPFAAAGTDRAARERGRYAPAGAVPGIRYVWEDVLDYVNAHPADPRAPEALYWLVRVSRFGKGHARSSFRAFRLLHARYGATSWARESRYFYD